MVKNILEAQPGDVVTLVDGWSNHELYGKEFEIESIAPTQYIGGLFTFRAVGLDRTNNLNHCWRVVDKSGPW